MLSGKKIIVGVTGSIAAYKAAPLVRLFVKEGAEVRVVVTQAAQKFVGDLTFSNLTQHPVFSDLWSGTWTEHVHLGTWADLMVIAPASANTLGKMAWGLCDNALTAVYLSARCPVMVAPAMDADMYAHPQTQRNLKQLENAGVEVIPVGVGFLASGLEGAGRMAEPEAIFERVKEFFGGDPLKGIKVLITAGPTREYIDPVRFISNPSTGKMGYALAAEAHRLGAEVTLISGPVDASLRAPVEPVRVISADEMYEATMSRLKGQHLVIMTAAVGDYRTESVAKDKIKKADGGLTLDLVRTRDILATAGKQKESAQVLVGFALETENEIENARKKLEAKALDYIVLNSLRDAGAGFEKDTNLVTLLNKRGDVERYPLESKTAVARMLLARIITDQGYGKKN
jgi:phosphopantothenoylcysteine decarboxylase / phosphopantothenate---cysteine ligase